MSQKVGVIGLGAMGGALADALLDHQFDLAVWNRSPGKSDRFAEQGVVVADSAASLASACDVIVACLLDLNATLAVLDKPAVRQALAGKTLVLLCTMTAEESIAAAAWAGDHGIACLDGAIIGYPANVRDQACVVVYSGPQALFESCHAILFAMGGMPRLIGAEAGIAQQFAWAVYSTYYTRTVGLIQGAALCRASGAPLETFTEIMTEYWDHASHDAGILRQVKERDYSGTECALEVHANAYEGIPETFERCGVSSELQRAICGYLDKAVAQGYGECELAALVEIMGRPQA